MEIIGLGPASIFDFMTFGGQVLHYKLLKGKDNGRKRSSQKKKKVGRNDWWRLLVGNYLDGQKMKSWWRFLTASERLLMLSDLLAARIAIVGWMAKFYTAWVTKLLADGFFLKEVILFGCEMGKWFRLNNLKFFSTFLQKLCNLNKFPNWIYSTTALFASSSSEVLRYSRCPVNNFDGMDMYCISLLANKSFLYCVFPAIWFPSLCGNLRTDCCNCLLTTAATPKCSSNINYNKYQGLDEVERLRMALGVDGIVVMTTTCHSRCCCMLLLCIGSPLLHQQLSRCCCKRQQQQQQQQHRPRQKSARTWQKMTLPDDEVAILCFPP